MKSLESLIYPVSADEFFKENWNKVPLYLTREGVTEHPLLGVSDIDEYLNSQLLVYPFVRIVKTGEETEVNPSNYLSASASESMKVIDKVKLFDLYKQGYTIVIQWVHLTFDKLNNFVSLLSLETGLRFHINIYITPPNSKGFDAHYDTHAVFILQVNGVKEWNLYDAPYTMPTKELEMSKEDRQKYRTVKPSYELRMQTGDLLYIPCGVVHDAYTTDSPSIHMTLGCHEVKGIDLLKLLVEEAYKYPFFRFPCYPIQDKTDELHSSELFLREVQNLLGSIIDKNRINRKLNKREDFKLEETFENLIAMNFNSHS